ncbi:MAG: tRNA-dihydrouridine synthase family protein [Leptospira sp.]|nr:tRNA-dihydrouridine synthase family protein [Leptospira sp.]
MQSLTSPFYPTTVTRNNLDQDSIPIEPSFFIRDIPFHGRVCLSPMAGVSDSPHRLLARRFGSAWSYTEFVAAEQILIGNPKTIKLFSYSEEERPVTFQIFGNSIETITEAAIRIEPLKPDIIDLNMGCSTHRVSQRGSGAGLLKNLPLAGKMIESLRKNCKVPITAKIRIGWDNENLNYKDTIRSLQDSGVEAISVHGRTKEMSYNGLANWDVIAEIKSLANVPIFGNGDINSYPQINKRLQESRVDAVLIGRGAIGNPWIFSGIEKEDLDFDEINKVAKIHYDMMVDFYTREHAFRLFKKYFKNYTEQFDFYREKRDEILRIQDPSEFEDSWESSIFQLV